MTRTRTASSHARGPAAHAPELRVTRYDRVSSSMMAVLVGLAVAVAVLTMVYVTNWTSRADSTAELELIELAGGVPDGAVDETLRLDSPEEVRDDPAMALETTEEMQIEETIENVLELADEAAEQVQQQFELDAQDTGEPGSATGTGRRPLGEGPGAGGFPRHQRWFVRFSERGTLTGYARQLDYFGIELGALLPDGRLVYVSNLSDNKPRVRESKTGAGEERLYMNWQGGGRRQADLKLFRKAGIDVGTGLIFHFYPRDTEAMLARKELAYKNRPVKSIRRTYFVVRSVPDGYDFEVTNQTYF